MMTFFDIESCSQPPEVLERIAPKFSAPGNYKDPDKIAANIAEQKEAWMQRGALSPLTGRVLCVGVMEGEDFRVFDGGGDERKLLLQIAELFQSERKFAGFNCRTFDCPFLIKRAWLLGVTPPIAWNHQWNRSDKFTDLRDVWQCGDRQADGSLDVVSRFFGGDGKNGSGKDFATLWNANKDVAVEYLENDLKITKHIASMMGIA